MCSSSSGVLSFHYESAWEKLCKNGENPLGVKDSFKVTRMKCNMDFFTHEAFEEVSFSYFVTTLFNIMTMPHLNPNRSLEQFWKNVNAFAQKLLDLHPDWIENITQSLEKFDREQCIPFMQKTE